MKVSVLMAMVMMMMMMMMIEMMMTMMIWMIILLLLLEYRCLIPSPVDRVSAILLVIQSPMDNMSNHMNMTHIACET